MIVTGQPVVEWVAQRTGEFGNFGAAVGIGVERDGVLVGGVVFNEWNGPNCNMHAAAVERSGWLTRPALWYFFDYPFNQAKVNRITALVGEGNVKSRKLTESAGFVLETSLSGADPSGDLLVYVMRRAQCPWLNLKVPHEEQRLAA